MNNEPVAWMTTIYRDDNLLNRVKLPQFHQTKPPPHFYDDIQPLYTHPAKTLAKQRYDDCMKDCDEPNPIERLRFFLSCALTGQDWLDVEPFIDAISHPAKTLTDEEIVSLYKETEADNGGIREFARAILRKAQEK